MKKDKLYHLIAGFVIGFAFSFWRPGEAILAAMTAGVLKEVYDKYGKKTEADPLDAIATTIGGVIGAIASLLVQNVL